MRVLILILILLLTGCATQHYSNPTGPSNPKYYYNLSTGESGYTVTRGSTTIKYSSSGSTELIIRQR